jgi:site-specific DNA-methyltransferase (adenine-specific)
MPINIVHLADCMDIMRNMSDKSVDLCIIDPPYGIGGKFKGGKSGKMQFNEIVEKGWDCVPDDSYFQELFRVSKNQIIWGGNYFDLPPSRCFIVWDKQISEDFTLAMAELAWTSFDKLAKIFRMPTPKDGAKIHPTQKPVALYKWILKNYAKPNDKIFDSHVGSGSIRIACHDMGFDFEGCEIDKDYWEAQEKRYHSHVSQQDLFTPEVIQETIYQNELL